MLLNVMLLERSGDGTVKLITNPIENPRISVEFTGELANYYCITEWFIGADCDPVYDFSLVPSNTLITVCRDKTIRKYDLSSLHF